MANSEHVEVVRQGKEAIARWRGRHADERLDLSDANLSLADLSTATCSITTFANWDLTGCHGLESVVHTVPSSIGIDTIIKSGGNIPQTFLMGAGVPGDILDALLPLVSGEKKYYRCFISYTSGDAGFATLLHRDLEA